MTYKIISETTIRPNMGGGNALLLKARNTHPSKWVLDLELSDRLSGTLKKGLRHKGLGRQLLFEETIAQVFGWRFEILPASYVTFGEILLEGDCPPITEFYWHLDRMIAFNRFDEDLYSGKYVIISNQDSTEKREGLAIVLDQTSCQWIPDNNVVLALIAEYDPKTKCWGECHNPF